MSERTIANELISQCVNFLTSKNITVEKVEAPYVFFDYTIKERTLHCAFIAGEGDDSNFCRFVIPNIEVIDAEQQRVLQILNGLTADYKVGKAFLSSEGKVWLGVEVFVYSKENLKPLYERIFNTMVHLCEDYMLKINQ